MYPIKESILDQCSEMFDKITIIKGFFELQNHHKNVDYSLAILKELSELESSVSKIVDIIKQAE